MQSMLGTKSAAQFVIQHKQSEYKLYIYLSRLNTIKLSLGKMTVGSHHPVDVRMFYLT